MPGPLDGVRVVDFGQYLAGPFGPMLLADLGADVIKVEPTRGDGMRNVVGPFLGCQRGKRDIAIDLKQPEGLRIALELVATADIVHHNMTLGTADRREAEKRAYHLGCLLRAIFEQQDDSFTDEAPLPHQTVAEEVSGC